MNRITQNTLDRLWTRDPRRLFPPTRVFVPVWTEAGKKPALVTLVHEDYVPNRSHADLARFGDPVEDYQVDNATYYCADQSAFEDALRVAQQQAAIGREKDAARETFLRRAARRERRAVRASRSPRPRE